MTSKVRIKSPERRQLELKQSCCDDLIPANHRARLVWKFVESMDLSAISETIRSREGSAGRDAIDPKLLFSLWLYASVRGVGSARELDRLCRESKPYQWLCGGVSVNYHTLADFRVGNGEFLDRIFTRSIAILVKQDLVTVRTISQDGTRVRASAGASSFRREKSLKKLRKAAKKHIRSLNALFNDPAKSAGLTLRKRSAMMRAAKDREERLERALALIPGLKKKQERLSKKLTKQQKEHMAVKNQPRASTTDDEAKRIKMSNGGYQPGVNFQIAVDTDSRAIVGLDAISEGYDNGQLVPMREQVEKRTGLKVQNHLADAGYTSMKDIETAAENNVNLYVPPKPRMNKEKYGDEFTPKPGEKKEIAEWRIKMGSKEGKEMYKKRCSTVETVNADLKSFRGLKQLTVRGLAKARSVGLWSALAYNLLQFGEKIINSS